MNIISEQTIDALRIDYQEACDRRAASFLRGNTADRRQANLECGRAALALARATGDWILDGAYGRERWACTWCGRKRVGTKPNAPCDCRAS